MELTSQVITFLMTIVTGILLGMLFDGYRVLRGIFNPRILATGVADLLYWIIATGVVFTSLVLSNWGELRFYVFIGILSGLGLYYKWCSIWAIRLLSSGIKLIMNGVKLMKKIIINGILRPILYCMRLVSWPFMFCWHKMRIAYHSRCIKLPEEEEK